MNKILLVLTIFLMLFFLSGCMTAEETDVVIYLNSGIDTVEINSQYIDSGATSKAFGLIVDNEVIYNDVDITELGSYLITYQVEYKNVTKTISRVVNVVDETFPTGTLNPGVDTIKVGSTWIDASVSTEDNSGDPVTIEIIGNVNTNIEGEYIITYLIEDTSGNQNTLVRYVSVYE